MIKKKIFYANKSQKRVRIAILISDKIGFKSDTVTETWKVIII